MSLLWSLRVAIAAIVMPLLLRTMSMERLVTSLGRRARVKTPSQQQQVRIAERVDRVLGWLPTPWERTCLTRSTILYHLLRRSGVPVQLCLGVKPGPGGFAAHAWLESSGDLYLEPVDAKSFKVIARFPALTP
jgi:Transglutaminase-like superfamily